jgi:hypothetical protein
MSEYTFGGRKELRVTHEVFRRGFDFHLLERRLDGQMFHVSKVEMEPLEDHAWNPQPLVTLHDEEAQALMDELWQCGLRPSEGSGSAGSLAATERHLEDMRKLVFEPPIHRLQP